MAGLTNAEAKDTLDVRFPTTGAGDFVGYSINGTTEFAGLARTAIGATGWAAATAADPSVKANANTLNTAAATAAASNTAIYYAVFSASTGGVQRTDWTALTDNAGAPRTFSLVAGDALKHDPGKIAVTLT